MPNIHKDTIIKEVEGLCKLGVLERQPASEWALPSFIIPKKDRTVCFLSDFWEVNKRLVRKSFPIPKFKQGLARVRWIHLCNSPRSKYGLLHHKIGSRCIQSLHHHISLGNVFLQAITGIAGSPDIFQGKMLELMESLEYLRLILITSSASLS